MTTTPAHQQARMSSSHRAITVAIAMIALAITAPGAQAAATRAEYVAQVDPICQAAIGPQAKALSSFSKAFEHFRQRVRSGRITKGTFTKLLRQTAGFLSRYKGIGANVTTRIEAVPPPPRDTGTVTLWLLNRRAAEQLVDSAVSALKHYRLKAYFRLLAQAEATEAGGRVLVSSFGFQYCA
jgi:hypothetical protein